MSLQELLVAIKSRVATTDSPSKNLARSVHDKLQNFLKQGEKYFIKNIHLPEGDLQKVATLREDFEAKFDFPLPAPLASFYELFDGFELHTQDLSPTILQPVLQDNDWTISGVKIDEKFPNLSLEEWRTDENRSSWEAVANFVGLYDPMDSDTAGGSLTRPKAKDFSYYGDTTHLIPVEGNNTTIIPPADRLFSAANKAGEVNGIELYYFDVFSSFYQIVIGIKDKKAILYQANYGYGDLQKIKEDIPTYLKKVLVRGLL